MPPHWILPRKTHTKLLESQNRQCSTCGYRFTDTELKYFFAEEIEFTRQEIATNADEVMLQQYNRRPVLDHIVPYFLGGDTKENWQILCASCNSGKGDALSWMFRSGWMPVRRLGGCNSPHGFVPLRGSMP